MTSLANKGRCNGTERASCAGRGRRRHLCVHGARFSTEIYTRGCHWFPRLLASSEQSCDQWHSSRVSTFLTSSHCKLRPNTEGLQSAYTEYGCDDYPQTLRRMAAGSAFTTPVRFLHCPIPDFGVLDDASLLALVATLQQELKNGHTLYVNLSNPFPLRICLSLSLALTQLSPRRYVRCIGDR
jgi:hypothetical protein